MNISLSSGSHLLPDLLTQGLCGSSSFPPRGYSLLYSKNRLDSHPASDRTFRWEQDLFKGSLSSEVGRGV